MNKNCGCKDKDVAAIAAASARRNEGKFVGTSKALEKLVNVYNIHKVDGPILNKLCQAKVSDFSNPAMLNLSVEAGRRYAGLLNRLRIAIAEVVAETFNDKMELDKKLAELSHLQLITKAPRRRKK